MKLSALLCKPRMERTPTSQVTAEGRAQSGPEQFAAVPGSAISRFDVASRELTRRTLEENPALLAETVARHYTSLSTTAMQLRECIAARRVGAEGIDEMIAHYLARLRQCYVHDFGAEPHWPNAELSNAAPSTGAIDPK